MGSPQQPTARGPQIHVEAPLTEKELYTRPWQHIGYRIFSQWGASDDDFFVMRRFGALNTRVILKLQDDIAKLENELSVLEKENSRVGGPAVNNGSFRHDRIGRRGEILNDCYVKLKEYSTLHRPD